MNQSGLKDPGKINVSKIGERFQRKLENRPQKLLCFQKFALYDCMVRSQLNILLGLFSTFSSICIRVGTRKSNSCSNRPRSIYQYSSMAPRLSGQNCKFFKFLLSLNSQKRLGYKENNTKYRSLTRKPRSHVRILIYRTWPIPPALGLIAPQTLKTPSIFPSEFS